MDFEERFELAGAGEVCEIGDLQAQGGEHEMLARCEGTVVLRFRVDLRGPGVFDVVVDDAVVAGAFLDVDFDNQVRFFGAAPGEDGFDFILVEFGGIHFPSFLGVGSDNGHADTGVGDGRCSEGKRGLEGLGDAEGLVQGVVVVI